MVVEVSVKSESMQPYVHLRMYVCVQHVVCTTYARIFTCTPALTLVSYLSLCIVSHNCMFHCIFSLI